MRKASDVTFELQSLLEKHQLSLFSLSYCKAFSFFVFLADLKITWFQQPKPKQPAASNALSADSGMSNPAVKEDDSSLCIPVRQAISYSGFTGESIPEEYQDCGVSPMLLMGEPPWLPPGPDGSFAGIRDSAITRYKEKKKRRK